MQFYMNCMFMYTWSRDRLLFYILKQLRLLVIFTKKKSPQKTVNIMSLVILDIEYFENNIVKEVQVYKNG